MDIYQKNLPQEVRYLLIPAKELVKLSAEELAELAECDILIQAVQRKVKDLSSERVKLILTEHYEKLGLWLEEHTSEPDFPPAWNYIYEFLYNASLHADMIFDFDEEDEIPPPPGRLVMNIPQNLKADQKEHEIHITDGPAHIVINHIDEETYDHFKHTLHYTLGSSEPGACSSRSITLEHCRGRRYTQTQTEDGGQKLSYLLEFSNGWVFVDIESAEPLDENAYDELVGSIQIELKEKKDP